MELGMELTVPINHKYILCAKLTMQNHEKVEGMGGGNTSTPRSPHCFLTRMQRGKKKGEKAKREAMPQP